MMKNIKNLGQYFTPDIVADFMVSLECPFCKNMGVEAIYYKAHMEADIKRISNKSTTKLIPIPERYEPISGCEFCKKSKKDVKDMLDGKISIVSHEDRIKRLQEAGLPLKIESSR